MKHQCYKCGKETEYNQDNEIYTDVIKSQSCWTIDLGQAGYGSVLDGCEISFGLCDECLDEIISTFVHKDKIYNSGANFRYED